jgi:hypothetical protein
MIHPMAVSFSKLFDYLRNPFQPAKQQQGKRLAEPARPVTPEELRKKAFLDYLDRQAASERELKERELEIRRSDPVWRFVYDGETKTWPASTNVDSAWYDIDKGELFIKYQDGSLYRYESISPHEAESFARSASAGTWVWDVLRVRGTKLGARKEYHMVYSGDRSRAWEQTEESAREHAEEVSAQSGAKSAYEKLGKFALKHPVTNKGRRARPKQF